MDDLRIPQIQSSDMQTRINPQGEWNSARVDRVLKSEGLQSSSDSHSFSGWLNSAMTDANRDQLSADHAIKELVAGKTKNVHEAMMAVEKADLSFKLMMQVRNKLLDAYREIMRMQV